MEQDTIVLRLEGEQLSARILVKKIEAFVDLLREVDRSVTEEREATGGDARSIKWIVQAVHSGSPVTLTLRPELLNDEIPADAGERIISAVVAGLATIESPVPMQRLPRYFSLPVLEYVHDLVDRGTDGVTGVTNMASDQTVVLTSTADQNLHRFLAPSYASYGSVEGFLFTDG